MIGIYRITSPSGRVNIGQTWDINARKRVYKSDKAIKQPKLYNSIIKYGWDAHVFEVLQELPSDITQEVLDQFEIVFIEEYRNCGYKMMNIRGGGSRECKTSHRYQFRCREKRYRKGHFK